MPGRIAAMSLAALRPEPLRRELGLDALDAVHFPLSVMLPPVASTPTAHDGRSTSSTRSCPSSSAAPSSRTARPSTAERSAARASWSRSPSTRGQTLIERFGLAPERVRAIPLAVDHDAFRPDDAVPRERIPALSGAAVAAQEPRPALRSVRSAAGTPAEPAARPHRRGRLRRAARRRRGARARLAGRARPALPRRSGARLPVAVRGIRDAGARGDGVRLSRRVLERDVAAGGRRRRGAPVRPARRRTTIAAAVDDVLDDPDAVDRARARARAGASRGTRAHAPTTRSTASSPPAEARGRAARAARRRAARRARRTTTSGDQPSRSRAFAGSPTRSCSSALPRLSDSSMCTYSRQSRPTCSNAQRTSSSTLCSSPVAIT